MMAAPSFATRKLPALFSPMDRYVVIGNPVSHSLSPAIHARFAEQMGERIEYATLLVAPGEFQRATRRFFETGGSGANVTLPFKVDAFDFADIRSERAEIAGAANFLQLRAGRIEADNTDGAGLVADLARNLGVRLRGSRILLVGAGGAARGVLAPLLAEKPARVAIANRTVERARELAAHFRPLGTIDAFALDAIPAGGFDLIVNATSASTNAESLALPQGVFDAQAFAYDMAYGPAARAFVDRARARGMKASDGLGMLVEQAAESFRLWRGKRPATAEVLAQLRSRLA
jgi:shikimate dehydrogenase